MADPAFDAFVQGADAAMLVVTVHNAGADHGCLVGFHTQVSIDPLHYAVCLSHENATYRSAVTADHLAVHLLGDDQGDLAELFGGHTTDEGFDKFGACRWERSPEGPPLLAGVPAWFVGRIHARFTLGDHTAHVLEPLRAGGAGLDRGAAPLRYGAVRYLDPGHDA